MMNGEPFKLMPAAELDVPKSMPRMLGVFFIGASPNEIGGSAIRD
jgi:hypothetical protein